MFAKDIMTKDVVTVSLFDGTKKLAELLTQNQISGTPVLDGNGKIVGMVSEADIITKRGRQVKDIMNKQVISVTEESTLERIALLMSTYRIKRLPVLRGKELVGIVSRADIVGAVARGKHIAMHTPIYDL